MARGVEKMPRFFVGRGAVKQKSCDHRIEKTIREQFYVNDNFIERRSECSGRGHHLTKARS
jgi:hypothetical protein